MLLPNNFAWLAKEPGPRMLLEALKLYGVTEAAGAADNPVILGWAKELGLQKTYSHDSIPWCGLFMALIAHRAGFPVVDSPLWALSWADFGVPAPKPMLGDILTFKRSGGGHVAQYVAEDPIAFYCLGANQSDQVNIARISKARFYRARRPSYPSQPANVRQVFLTGSGVLSQNEA